MTLSYAIHSNCGPRPNPVTSVRRTGSWTPRCPTGTSNTPRKSARSSTPCGGCSTPASRADLAPLARRTVDDISAMYEQAGDHPGDLGDRLDRAVEIYARACTARPPDPEKLADWILEVEFDGPGRPVIDLAEFATALGEPGLRRIKSTVDDVLAASGPGHRRDVAERLQEQLAEVLGDVDGLVAILSAKPPRVDVSLKIVRVLRAAGRRQRGHRARRPRAHPAQAPPATTPAAATPRARSGRRRFAAPQGVRRAARPRDLHRAARSRDGRGEVAGPAPGRAGPPARAGRRRRRARRRAGARPDRGRASPTRPGAPASGSRHRRRSGSTWPSCGRPSTRPRRSRCSARRSTSSSSARTRSPTRRPRGQAEAVAHLAQTRRDPGRIHRLRRHAGGNPQAENAADHGNPRRAHRPAESRNLAARGSLTG